MWYAIAVIIALICMYAAFSTSRQIWNILDIPTVSPSGAIVGLGEITGKASTIYDENEQLKPLVISPLAGLECVWFSLLVEHYVTSGDDDKWETLFKYSSSQSFRVVDGYGGVVVNAEKAKKYLTVSVDKSKSEEFISTSMKFFNKDAGDYNRIDPRQDEIEKWQTSPDGLYMFHPALGKYIPTTYVSPDKLHFYDDQKQAWQDLYKPSTIASIAYAIGDAIKSVDSNSKYKKRVTETVITPMQDIYVHGFVEFPEESIPKNELVVRKGDSRNSDFYISSKGEQGPLKSLKITRAVLAVISLLIAFILVLVTTSTTTKSRNIVGSSISENISSIHISAKALIIFAFVVVFGFAFLKLGRTFNRFVRLKQQVSMSSSTIDIVLKRRSTLIPQLKTVIDESAKHEASVQKMAAELRTVKDDDFAKSIFGLEEAYPNLKTTANFMQLQLELGRTEEKIAMARSFLNDSVLNYNNLRATFVGIIYSPFFKKI